MAQIFHVGSNYKFNILWHRLNCYFLIGIVKEVSILLDAMKLMTHMIRTIETITTFHHRQDSSTSSIYLPNQYQNVCIRDDITPEREMHYKISYTNFYGNWFFRNPIYSLWILVKKYLKRPLINIISFIKLIKLIKNYLINCSVFSSQNLKPNW